MYVRIYVYSDTPRRSNAPGMNAKVRFKFVYHIFVLFHFICNSVLSATIKLTKYVILVYVRVRIVNRMCLGKLI